MKKIFVITLAAFAFAACSKNIETPTVNTIIATTDCNIQKTQLDGAKVVWESGDAINVFCQGTSYKFATEDSGETAKFSGDGIALSENVYSYFPYTDGISFSGGVFTGASMSTTVQTLKADNMGSKTNIAVGKYNGTALKFLNAGAFLKFKLTQEGADTLRKIELKSNNGETIAFDGSFGVNYNSGAPVISIDGSAEKSATVKLKAEGGQFETGKTYYVWVVPGTFAAGVTITLYGPTLYEAKKVGSTSLSVSRNDIIDLGEIGGLTFSESATEKKTLVFDFTGTAQEGWPTKDHWGSVEEAPFPDSTVVYTMVDKTKYNFVLSCCQAATESRIAWTGTGVTLYAAQRFLGLPVVKGYRLFAVKCVQGTTPRTSRKGAITDRVTQTTADPYHPTSGGESVVWDTANVSYYLDETKADTMYYLACTAGGIGTSVMTLIYEKVEN